MSWTRVAVSFSSSRVVITISPVQWNAFHYSQTCIYEPNLTQHLSLQPISCFTSCFFVFLQSHLISQSKKNIVLHVTYDIIVGFLFKKLVPLLFFKLPSLPFNRISTRLEQYKWCVWQSRHYQKIRVCFYAHLHNYNVHVLRFYKMPPNISKQRCVWLYTNGDLIVHVCTLDSLGRGQ